MSSVKEAQEAYKKARVAFKTAQEDPTTTDEEKKKQRESMDELADKTVDVMAQSKTAEDVDLDFIPPSEDADESNILERNNLAQEEKKDEDDKNKEAKDDEVKELKEKVAQMEYSQNKMKLAQKYASVFPEPMREAKMKEFMSIKEPIKVLTARVDEAVTLMSRGNAVKVAQYEPELFNLEDSQSNAITVNYGGKI